MSTIQFRALYQFNKPQDLDQLNAWIQDINPDDFTNIYQRNTPHFNVTDEITAKDRDTYSLRVIQDAFTPRTHNTLGNELGAGELGYQYQIKLFLDNNVYLSGRLACADDEAIFADNSGNTGMFDHETGERINGAYILTISACKLTSGSSLGHKQRELANTYIDMFEDAVIRALIHAGWRAMLAKSVTGSTHIVWVYAGQGFETLTQLVDESLKRHHSMITDQIQDAYDIIERMDVAYADEKDGFAGFFARDLLGVLQVAYALANRLSSSQSDYPDYVVTMLKNLVQYGFELALERGHMFGQYATHVTDETDTILTNDAVIWLMSGGTMQDVITSTGLTYEATRAEIDREWVLVETNTSERDNYKNVYKRRDGQDPDPKQPKTTDDGMTRVETIGGSVGVEMLNAPDLKDILDQTTVYGSAKGVPNGLTVAQWFNESVENIQVDPDLPADTIEFRNPDGTVVKRVTNVGLPMTYEKFIESVRGCRSIDWLALACRHTLEYFMNSVVGASGMLDMPDYTDEPDFELWVEMAYIDLRTVDELDRMLLTDGTGVLDTWAWQQWANMKDKNTQQVYKQPLQDILIIIADLYDRQTNLIELVNDCDESSVLRAKLREQGETITQSNARLMYNILRGFARIPTYGSVFLHGEMAILKGDVVTYEPQYSSTDGDIHFVIMRHDHLTQTATLGLYDEHGTLHEWQVVEFDDMLIFNRAQPFTKLDVKAHVTKWGTDPIKRFDTVIEHSTKSKHVLQRVKDLRIDGKGQAVLILGDDDLYDATLMLCDYADLVVSGSAQVAREYDCQNCGRHCLNIGHLADYGYCQACYENGE